VLELLSCGELRLHPRVDTKPEPAAAPAAAAPAAAAAAAAPAAAAATAAAAAAKPPMKGASVRLHLLEGMLQGNVFGSHRITPAQLAQLVPTVRLHAERKARASSRAWLGLG